MSTRLDAARLALGPGRWRAVPVDLSSVPSAQVWRQYLEGVDAVVNAVGILREAPGVMLIDKREDGGYVTPVECVGDGATFVSRVREDSTVDNGLSLWCVSDNLRKGAALNAVQIAELLGRRHLKKG